MRPADWIRELRGQPLIAFEDGSRAKGWIAFAGYFVLAQVLPSIQAARAGREAPLTEMTPAIVLLGLLVLAVATDHVERSARARVMLVVGAMAMYFLVALPLVEFIAVDVHAALHFGPPFADSGLTGRAIAGFSVLGIVTRTSRWMLRDPRRSLDIQFV